MSRRVDLFTPWREPPSDLRARHVGRNEELDGLRREARAFLAGGRPLPVYLYGPRGTGKSHLLALLRDELEEKAAPASVSVLYVGEDIPEFRSPADLLERLDTRPAGTRWRKRREPVEGRRIVLLEGFDRQLQALGVAGRKKLRTALQDDPDRWLVATGVGLITALTDPDEPLFGAFAPWPLGPLTPDEATQLLDTLAQPEEGTPALRWPARRRTLVTLAGGSPRSLMALGLAAREDPTVMAADDLLAALQGLTSHYQQRYRDQSPDGQRVVTLLAEERGEVTPSGVARELGWISQKASLLLNRMTDAGVLRRRIETDEERAAAGARGEDLRGGPASLYSIGEPLFRYWLEYRNAPWEETRVGMLGRMLEHSMTDDEIISAWLRNPDEQMQAAALSVMGRRRSAAEAAGDRLRDELEAALEASDHQRVQELVGRLPDIPHQRLRHASRALARALWSVDARLVRGAIGERLAELSPRLAALVDFLAALQNGQPPRAVLGALLAARHAPAESDVHDAGAIAVIVFFHVRAALRQWDGHGRPWVLRPSEVRRAARFPGLRGLFLLQGRSPAHRPLLAAHDVVPLVRPADGDQQLLLSVAARLGDGELFRSAARPAPTTWLATPFSALDVAPDLDAFDGLVPTSFIEDVVSWGSTLARLDRTRWTSLLERVEGRPLEEDLFVQASLHGLVALAAAAPDRLSQLREVMHPSWSEHLDEAAVLVEELRLPTRGRLHFELEALRALLLEPASQS